MPQKSQTFLFYPRFFMQGFTVSYINDTKNSDSYVSDKNAVFLNERLRYEPKVD